MVASPAQRTECRPSTALRCGSRASFLSAWASTCVFSNWLIRTRITLQSGVPCKVFYRPGTSVISSPRHIRACWSTNIRTASPHSMPSSARLRRCCQLASSATLCRRYSASATHWSTGSLKLRPRSRLSAHCRRLGDGDSLEWTHWGLGYFVPAPHCRQANL
ncbi:hypothetical protein D9M70_520100 [compost metagenome]